MQTEMSWVEVNGGGKSWVEVKMSWVEVDGAGWSWVEVDGAGWRWMELGGGGGGARFSKTHTFIVVEL